MRYILPAIALFLLIPLVACSKADSARSTIQAVPIEDATHGLDLSTSGWKLWLDPKVPWEKDRLYLPDEADLSKMPVNPPTGGWGVLQDQAGIAVQLPSTVEEHFWGKLGLRRYSQQYAEENTDFEVKCGSYSGVSWWWRDFEAPVVQPGQRLIISFRGARLRAEVMVNGKLCGYSIFASLPFEADITDAVKPGAKNQLSVRITNPGGSLDWSGWGVVWNGLRLPAGRGFGGLDASIRMQVRDPVAVSDLAVLNKPNPREVSLLVEVKSTGAAYDGPVHLTISRSGINFWQGNVKVNVPASGVGKAQTEVSLPAAELWSLEHPVLYTVSASIPSYANSGSRTDFGFRWFTAEGIGTAAPKLVLNGKRIVVRSAISWGFYGNNGAFADKALAEKDVNAAKALGLNCLNFHRDLGRAEVMDAADRLGLLRYEEPGTQMNEMSGHEPQGVSPAKSTQGPIDTSGKGGETPSNWSERYSTERVLRMVKRDRSHPCLVIYSLSNEATANFKNPRLWAFMRQMHELDPSRVIINSSGGPRNNQVLYLPYETAVRYADATGKSGWLNTHRSAMPGAWQDAVYKGPADFLPSQGTYDPGEILDWGEALCSAMPDNHAKITRDYQTSGKEGYDRADHERILAAYEKFMDDYGFRADFKTADALFNALGEKGYFAIQKAVEHMRMLNKTDMIALSGWESTAIENHSGLVDVHRNFKADPALIKKATEPEVLVLRPRHFVTAEGEKNIMDVHLINEVNRKGPHTLAIKVLDATGKTEFETSRPVTVTGGDTYGELLIQGIEFATKSTGTLKLRATLTPQGGGASLDRTEEIFVVPAKKWNPQLKIAVAGNALWVWDWTGKKAGVPTVSLSDSTPPDAIVLTWRGFQESKEVNGSLDGIGESLPPDTEPDMYHKALLAESTPNFTECTRYSGLAKGTAQVELYFVEQAWQKSPEAAARLFDVGINDQTVLTNFNITKESGTTDHHKVVAKKFTVAAPEGVVSLSFKTQSKVRPVLSAIKVTDAAGKIIREYAGAEPWKTASGITWTPLVRRIKELNELVATILPKVKQGSRLVLLPNNDAGVKMLAAALADAGVWKYNGVVGPSEVDYMGSWYFARKHWLFDGLPTGCALNWQYQVIPSHEADGLLIEAPGLEVAAGYGRDHKAQIGMGAGYLPHVPGGKGSLVFFAMLPSMAGPTATRLLLNALTPQ